MKYFDNAVLMRRAFTPKEGENAYRVHCFSEDIVIEQAKVNSPYSYSYKADLLNNQAIILLRSSSSLELPGERNKELILANNDQVTFIVELHTSKKSTTTGKVTAVTDEVERVQKLVNISLKNGFEVISAQQIDDCSKKLKKGINSFSLAGGKLYVEAKIHDKSLFEVAFVNGIGKKRNFGFGQICALEVTNND